MKILCTNLTISPIQSGQALLGPGDILSPLIKQLTEEALESKIDSYFSEEVARKRRNGNFELSAPSDRTGTFSPQFVKKYQTTLSDEVEQKIIALYGLGMAYKDISSHIQEMYAQDISSGTLAAVTDLISIRSENGRRIHWNRFSNDLDLAPSITKFVKMTEWLVRRSTRFLGLILREKRKYWASISLRVKGNFCLQINTE